MITQTGVGDGERQVGLQSSRVCEWERGKRNTELFLLAADTSGMETRPAF